MIWIIDISVNWLQLRKELLPGQFSGHQLESLSLYMKLVQLKKYKLSPIVSQNLRWKPLHRYQRKTFVRPISVLFLLFSLLPANFNQGALVISKQVSFHLANSSFDSVMKQNLRKYRNLAAQTGILRKRWVEKIGLGMSGQYIILNRSIIYF